MRIFDLAYDLAISVYALLKLLFGFKKYKKCFLKRVGVGFPKIEKGDKRLIWIHAVSVGEVTAVLSLIKKFKAEICPPLILISTVTETGYAIALDCEVDFCVYLPLDLSFIMRPILKRVQPDLVLVTETDFWYNFQRQAKKTAQLVVVNGKISERSFRRLKKSPFLTKKLLHPVDHFFVQGELYATRFQELGIEASKLTVTGNLKVDEESQNFAPSKLRERLYLTSECVLTLGSTHAPEERVWLRALKQIWTQIPTLKVCLVPRHPERFFEIEQLLQSESLSYSKWSEKGTFEKTNLLLVDVMGELKTCYAFSDLAFVGGSFTPKVGGHNILEPALFGKPVLFGPFMHSQPDFLHLVKQYQAGLQIEQQEIESTLLRLFSDKTSLKKMGEQGAILIEESRGALDRIFNASLCLLENRGL